LPDQESAPLRVGWRLPARELEDRVAAAVREMLKDQASILEAAQKTDIDSPNRPSTPRSTHLESPSSSEIEKMAALAALVERVELNRNFHFEGRVTFSLTAAVCKRMV